MPLILETKNRKHLKKVPTTADFGAITSAHLYSKQTGTDGIGNLTFTLPRNFARGTNTLIVFVNGSKAINTTSPLTNREYSETSEKTVAFGAPLEDTDIVEFYVAGTWFLSGTGEGGSGTLNSVYVNADYTLQILDRALVDSRVGAITISLPPNPVQGDVVEIIDAGHNAVVNNITINRNAKPLQGVPDNLVIDSNGIRIFLVYIDDSFGWKFTLTANEIGQVTGFMQYYYTQAIAGQQVFDLPFNINTTTGNIAIHIDGVKQTRQLAYTIQSPTSIAFTEALQGGERVEFESFNASSLGGLTYDVSRIEGVAIEGQSVIELGFEYTLGAKNIACYVNGRRVMPSLITEVDASTIELTFLMAENDTYLVESLDIGVFGG